MEVNHNGVVDCYYLKNSDYVQHTGMESIFQDLCDSYCLGYIRRF